MRLRWQSAVRSFLVERLAKAILSLVETAVDTRPALEAITDAYRLRMRPTTQLPPVAGS